MFSLETNEPKSIKIYDRKMFVPFMSIVDGIVGSGGSQLLSESIYNHIPMLALHRKGDSEQMLNIEMLRRKRLEHDLPPSIYGTSIESFLSSFDKEKNISDRKNHDRLSRVRESFDTSDEDSQIDDAIASKELLGFVDAVRNSVISQSYYNDIFHFLNNPYNEDEAAKIRDFAEKDNTPPQRNWMDGMPIASDVITEIVHSVLQ